MTAVQSTTATATAMCRADVGSHYEEATAKKPGSIAVKDRVSLDCTSSRCTMTLGFVGPCIFTNSNASTN